MRQYAVHALLSSLAVLWGCSSTVMVPVPPRMDLSGYGTLGIVDFASNSDRTIDTRATRQFQEHIQAAQPGARFIELGDRQALLAALGGKQFDAAVLRKIGERHGVSAVFLGDIVYAEPKTDVQITDLARLKGGMRAELRGDISSRLLDTKTGASVWSSSAWAKRQIGRVNVSERGVSAKVAESGPREEMVPALIYQLTHDFRPTSVRQPAR